ncbi:MAG: hypothetical protein JNK72_24690 [Myxococcales bacterium]|nr:hypothetical protein [Myxococcales bacterium]
MNEQFVTLSLGARFGISDDFEVATTLLPIVVSPDTDYQNPSFSIAYRVRRGSFDMALTSTLTLGVGDGGQSRFGVGLPMRWRGPRSRVDSGLLLSLPLEGSIGLAASIPLVVQFAPTETFHFGFLTGITAGFIQPGSETRTKQSISFPLGLVFGFTVRGSDGPLFDIDPYFQFPLFIHPAGREEINTDLWGAGVNVTGYFSL